MHCHGATIRLGEHSLSIGLAPCVGPAPVKRQQLPSVALNHGDTHPDTGLALFWIPKFNLIRERLSLNREPNVGTICIGLLEIESLTVQPDQNRKSLFPGRAGEVRTVWSG